MKAHTWGIAGMAFGGVLVWRSGAWLVGALRHPAPRAWPIVLMAALFVIGAVSAVWGARSYHRAPVLQED